MFEKERGVEMLSLLIVILVMVTGFLFHIAGKLLGGIFGIIGWLILGGLAISVFGLALFVFPIILIVGIVALAVAAAR